MALITRAGRRRAHVSRPLLPVSALAQGIDAPGRVRIEGYGTGGKRPSPPLQRVNLLQEEGADLGFCGEMSGGLGQGRVWSAHHGGLAGTVPGVQGST